MEKKNPIRIDFFGDKVESIKSFNPVSQISMKSMKSIFISSSLESPSVKNIIKILQKIIEIFLVLQLVINYLFINLKMELEQMV